MSKHTNTLMELNTRLFDQLDAVTNPDLDDEELKIELSRTEAVIDIAKTIISNADLCLRASVARDNKLTGGDLPAMLGDGQA